MKTKHLKYILVLLPLINIACLATLENARVNKDYNVSLNVNYISVSVKDKPTYIESSDLRTYFITGKLTKGYTGFIPFELGLSTGIYSLPEINVYVHKDLYTEKYISKFYPRRSNAKVFLSYFGKFQIYDKNDFAVSIRPEMYYDRFASTAIIASKDFENRSTYVSFKVFNRFIPDAEEKIDGSDLGYYISIGNKYFLKKYRRKSRFKYIFEIGIAKNFWYNDRFALVLSVGISIK